MGKSGLAEVFLAEETKLDSNVALKIPLDEIVLNWYQHRI